MIFVALTETEQSNYTAEGQNPKSSNQTGHSARPALSGKRTSTTFDFACPLEEEKEEGRLQRITPLAWIKEDCAWREQ